MKYIDSEKLIAEIKGLQCEQGFDTGEAERAYQSAIKDILAFIESLQQEQPEQDISEFEKALDDFGEAYATLVDRDNNPNQGIRINAYHELVQERINEILSLAKEYIKQKQPKKVYRVENENEQKGLWRKFDGTWEPLFDMLTDGQCKDMPMEDSPIYREGGKQWFASAPSKETLQKWFSKKDLEELTAKGFTISEFEVVGHKKISDFEYIFTRDNIISRTYLKVSDIYQQKKPDYKEAVQLVFEEKLIPFKDGNQWCFLLGRNTQEGICGFGDTILDAAVAFYKDYTNTRIHIGELQISMAP